MSKRFIDDEAIEAEPSEESSCSEGLGDAIDVDAEQLMELGTVHRPTEPLPKKEPMCDHVIDMVDDSDEPIEMFIPKQRRLPIARYELSAEFETPDLADYFANFPHVDEARQIAICRTYANYLNQKHMATRPTKGGTKTTSQKKRSKQ